MGMDPTEVLTEAEMNELELEAAEQISPIRRLQLENIIRLRQQLALYEAHPELVPYVSTYLNGPQFVDVSDDGIAELDSHEERYAERSRRRIKAQARVLRAAGFTIEKKLDEDGDLTIIATRSDLDFDIRAYAGGYCTYVKTDLQERVEVVEVPEEIQAAYTRIETKPVTKRVCAPLMTNQEVEEV